MDLSGLEQLLDSSQTRTIAECLANLEKIPGGSVSFKQLLDSIYEDLETDLAQVTSYKAGCALVTWLYLANMNWLQP